MSFLFFFYPFVFALLFDVFLLLPLFSAFLTSNLRIFLTFKFSVNFPVFFHDLFSFFLFPFLIFHLFLPLISLSLFFYFFLSFLFLSFCLSLVLSLRVAEDHSSNSLCKLYCLFLVLLFLDVVKRNAARISRKSRQNSFLCSCSLSPNPSQPEASAFKCPKEERAGKSG